MRVELVDTPIWHQAYGFRTRLTKGIRTTRPEAGQVPNRTSLHQCTITSVHLCTGRPIYSLCVYNTCRICMPWNSRKSTNNCARKPHDSGGEVGAARPISRPRFEFDVRTLHWRHRIELYTDPRWTRWQNVPQGRSRSDMFSWPSSVRSDVSTAACGLLLLLRF